LVNQGQGLFPYWSAECYGRTEVGGNAHGLPGYRFVTNPQHRAEVEQFWRLQPGQISPYPGRTASDIITGLENAEVGFLDRGYEPSRYNARSRADQTSLGAIALTVYQEVYHPTETSAYAHVLLPATQWRRKRLL
jgi:ferredoxin-nitrate reductase